MTTRTASQHHLHRVFLETSRRPTSPSRWPPLTPAFGGRRVAVMTRRAYKVAGIRKDGTICGYVRQEELAEGTCGEVLHPFEEGDVVAIRPDFRNSSCG